MNVLLLSHTLAEQGYIFGLLERVNAKQIGIVIKSLSLFDKPFLYDLSERLLRIPFHWISLSESGI